jgi:hypothetical protein
MGEKLVFKKILNGMFVFEHCGVVFASPPRVFEQGYKVRCGQCGVDFRSEELAEAVNDATGENKE